MILSKELCNSIAWKFAKRVTKIYVEKSTEFFNETVREILQENLSPEILKVAEHCSNSIESSTKLVFISPRGATQKINYEGMALPPLKPILLSGDDFSRLMRALNRSLDLADSIAAIQMNAYNILSELRVTDEILKYIPAIKEELDEVKGKYRGEDFNDQMLSYIKEIKIALDKTKEREQQYDVK